MAQNTNLSLIPGISPQDQQYREWLKNQTQQRNITGPIQQYTSTQNYGPKSPNFSSVSDTDKHTPVGGGGGMPWQMIATIAAQNVGSFFANLNPGVTSQDLLNNAGQTNASIGGINFQRQNTINKSDILDEYDKNNVSNIWKGNIGGFLGGWIGRSKLKEQIHNAEMQGYRTDAVNQDIVLSQIAQNQWYNRHDNTYGQIRTANEGLDFNINNAKQPVLMRPDEAKIDGEGNAIIPNDNGPKTDRIVTYVDDNTSILNPENTKEVEGVVEEQNQLKNRMSFLFSLINKNKGENKKIAYNILKGEINKAEQGIKDTQDIMLKKAEQQRISRYLGLIPQGDNYAMPQASVGWDSLITNWLTASQGIGDYIKTKRSHIKSPDTLVQPNIIQPLNTLNQLSIPIYPTLRQMRDAENRSKYQIAGSGGLGSSQKLAANVALTSNTQDNIANNLFNYYKERNTLKSQASMAALNAAQHYAQLAQNAKQYDLDYYSKAHAAKYDMMNTSLANIFGSIRQYVSDRDKLNRFNKMYQLYNDDLKSRIS